MNDYATWRQRYPQAATELEEMLGAVPWPQPEPGKPATEAASQQQARLNTAHQGAYAWRNNVGATSARCRDCGAPQQPVRYGLANDSAKLNKTIKSADLILAIPRRIRPEDVGSLIAQFGSVECKRPGWKFNPNDEHEVGQAKWLQLVASIGGFASFYAGGVDLQLTCERAK